MSKKRKRKIFSLILLVILALVVIIVLLQFGQIQFHFKLPNPFVKTEKIAESEILLTQTRTVFKLATIKVLYRTVFPFDFLPADIDLNGLLLREEIAPAGLSREQRDYLSMYRLTTSLGIEPAKNEFVVITSIIKGGYPLPDRSGSDTAETGGFALWVDEEGSLHIEVPDPEILEFIIEDEKSASYEYPDISINPENWRKLTSFVEEKIKQKFINEGFLQEADSNGRAFLRRLFREGGYQNVIFHSS
jgi:hypothetical protein